MSKQKLDMASMLNAPHFQAATAHESQLPPDPAIPVRVKVTLDQLVAYTDNPRVTQNPNYDDIKESIRNRGLDHAPNITRQSPDQLYMIKDGGNTRLAILNELWQETNDRKFYELDCMFYPWTSDLDVLVGHMVENEARGSMLFIERAIAAVKIKVQLEEQEQTTLSVRELSKRITALGWTVPHTHLSYLIYAHDTLFPVMPNTFWAGSGRPAVMAIRKMLDNSRTFWDSVATTEEGNFDEVWQSVFMTLDSEDFDIGDAQNKLEAVIAEKLNSPMMSIRGEIQAIAQGVSAGGIRPSNILTPPEPDSTSLPAPAQPPTSKSPSDLNQTRKVQEANPSNTPASPVASGGHTPEPVQQLVNPQVMPQTSMPALGSLLAFSTQELMENAFGLAVEYAAHFGFDSCVELPTHHGFNGHEGFHSGFVLLPPTKAVMEVAFEDNHVLLNYLYLFQLSNWCCVDHDDPTMKLVSINSPLSWISEENVNHANSAIMHMRAYSAALQLSDDTESRLYAVMEALETTVGILFGRCQAHLGQGV